MKKERAKRSPIWKCNVEELKTVVENSSTLSSVLKYFNLLNKGGNHKTLKKRLLYENIDYSHIKLGNNSNLGRNFKKDKIPIEKILVENSTYQRGHLKKRIIESNLLDYKCESCGIENTWNNKPIVLQLEHKNGISNDNRIENLCFLCPNCHSQTNTYAGKNLKSKKYFCECGNEICKSSEKCIKCEKSKRRKVKRPEKDELMKDIEELGYCGTGRKYGVSDNSIRKWLKNYNQQ